MNQYRFQVRTAVTWKIVTELYRRFHQKVPLAIFDVCPGIGHDDFLELHEYEIIPRQAVGEFNQHTQQLHYNPNAESRLHDLNWPDFNNYVQAYLEIVDTRQFILDMANVLGIGHMSPPYTPPSNATAVVLRMIAGLLERYMLSEEAYQVRSVYRYWPGENGIVMEEPFKLFPAQIVDTILKHISKDPFGAGSRYWFILKENPKKKVQSTALLDFKGVIYFPKQENEPWNVWQEYRHNGHNLSALVNRLDVEGAKT